MSTCKTSIHLWNTNDDILMKCSMFLCE